MNFVYFLTLIRGKIINANKFYSQLKELMLITKMEINKNIPDFQTEIYRLCKGKY